MSEKSGWYTGLLGALRGTVVDVVVRPVDVVRIQGQCNDPPEKSREIARRIFNSRGLLGFYQGFFSKFTYTVLRQAYYWPCIIYMPQKFSKLGLEEYTSKVATGFFAVTLDIAVTIPIRQREILAMVSKRAPFNLETIKNGWKGTKPALISGYVYLGSFLPAERFFRKTFEEKGKSSLLEAFQIGVSSSLVISPVCSPFTMYYCLNQVGKIDLKEFFLKYRWSVFRGFPLYVVSSAVHNTASSWLIKFCA